MVKRNFNNYVLNWSLNESLLAILFIIVSFIVFYFTNDNLSTGLLVFFLLTISFFSKKDIGYYIFSFFIPFYGVLTNELIGSLIPFLVLPIILRNIKNWYLLYIKDLFDWSLVLIFISVFISSIIGNNLLESLDSLIFVVIIFLLNRILNNNKQKVDIVHKMVIFYILGLSLSSIIGLLEGNFAQMWVMGTLKDRFYGLMGDANFYSRAILFGVAYLGMVLLILKTRISKIFYLLLLLFLFYVLLITVSKMGVLIFGILLITFLSFRLSLKSIFTSLLVFVTLSITVLNIEVFENSIDTIENRFKAVSDVSTLTTNRFDFQIKGLKAYISSNDITNYLVGFGMNSSSKIVSSVIKSESVFHSLYIETIVEQGILGIVALFLLLYTIINDKVRTNMILPIVVFMLSSFALSGLFYWDQVLFIVIVNNGFLKV